MALVPLHSHLPTPPPWITPLHCSGFNLSIILQKFFLTTKPLCRHLWCPLWCSHSHRVPTHALQFSKGTHYSLHSPAVSNKNLPQGITSSTPIWSQSGSSENLRMSEAHASFSSQFVLLGYSSARPCPAACKAGHLAEAWAPSSLEKSAAAGPSSTTSLEGQERSPGGLLLLPDEGMDFELRCSAFLSIKAR